MFEWLRKDNDLLGLRNSSDVIFIDKVRPKSMSTAQNYVRDLVPLGPITARNGRFLSAWDIPVDFQKTVKKEELYIPVNLKLAEENAKNRQE